VLVLVAGAVGLGLAAAVALAAPPLLSLTVSPTVIAPGDSAVLAWTGTDVTTCTASAGWSGPRDVAGSEVVIPAATTTYRLACEGPEGTVTRALTLMVQGDECDQMASCSIDSPSRSCLYPLTVGAQGIVRVTVKERAATLDAQWRLVDAGGAPAPACGVLSRSVSADCGPLPAGEYRLEVSAFAGTPPATGMADVHVQQLTACESMRIDCDQVVSGELLTPVDSDLLGFSVSDGEIVRVTAKPVTSTLGTLRLEWRLVTAAGTPANACDTFRRSVSADCGPLQAGEYRIQVHDEFRTGAGTFIVHLQRETLAAACETTQLFCDRTQRGDVDPGLDSDLFRFTVENGEIVRLTLDPRSGAVMPEWRLLNTDGTPALDCGAFQDRRADDCGPLAAGDYQVQVRDDTTQQTGDYEVTMQFLTRPCPNCGNGVVTGDEECDPPSGCCTADCRFRPADTICRIVAGVCDVAERCSGTSGECPIDLVVRPDTKVCHLAFDVCDLPESCDGRSALCPADRLKTAGATCRPAAGDCDAPETCTGVDPGCPAADRKRTAVCRPPAGPCDAGERCDGVGNDCPADALLSADTVCRPAAHMCDLAETCTGESRTCPPNLLLPGACGNGCADAGEVCGEPGLAACPAGTTCEACGCVPCASALLVCPADSAGDVEATLAIDAGFEPLGGYAVDLGWDPVGLGLAEIAGGEAAAFAAAPTCAVDETRGTASCVVGPAGGADAPTGIVSVARARFAGRDPTDPPAISLALRSAVDPAGAPLRLCEAVARCTLPECSVDADCDDADPCTADGCSAGHCQPTPMGGAEGVRCQLEEVRTKGFCGRDPIDGPLGRMIARRVTKGLRALDRASLPETPSAKRDRLLRRVDVQLGAIVARIQSLVRQERFPPKCGAYIEGLVTSSRALVAGLSF
jgi:hypothetical protein